MSWPGSNMFNNPQQNAREAGEGFDTMQVCLNGHKISEYAATMPQFSKPHCSTCGGRTIQECPECHAPIQGHYNSPGVFSVSEKPVPNNCHNCGTAYPWRQAAIASAIEVLQIDLIGQDAAEAAELVNAVAIDTPRTEISALKLKRLLPKLGKATYDVAVKVISDIASARLWPFLPRRTDESNVMRQRIHG